MIALRDVYGTLIMTKSVVRTYSLYSQDALQLLGRMIRTYRKEEKLTAQEAAERAGISRSLLHRIEKGDPKCQIGAVFEVAAVVGIQLFNSDETRLAKDLKLLEDKLTLLPKSIRKKTRVVDDNF